MPASDPARSLNQTQADSGIPNRFRKASSRSRSGEAGCSSNRLSTENRTAPAPPAQWLTSARIENQRVGSKTACCRRSATKSKFQSPMPHAPSATEAILHTFYEPNQQKSLATSGSPCCAEPSAPDPNSTERKIQGRSRAPSTRATPLAQTAAPAARTHTAPKRLPRSPMAKPMPMPARCNRAVPTMNPSP